ncbi:MAG: DUF6586 family protein [Oleiphilaceae bacterium]|nr:DUF6586 family protein [Oleiphilaceae bacterium]
MIDAKWHVLVQEKLTLARSLFRQLDQEVAVHSALERESLREGSVLMLEQARLLLLQHIARTCQHKDPVVRDLQELRALLGEDHAEVALLESLLEQRDNWWQTLDGWLAWLRRPRPGKTRPQPDNIIAVASNDGPDMGPEQRHRVADAMAAYLAEFSERHGEW